jgi:transcriptional regulator with XRE-family HTH domain
MDLKETLKTRGIKQRYIAEQAHIKDSIFSLYLSNKRRMPPEVKERIINILKDMGIFFE